MDREKIASILKVCEQPYCGMKRLTMHRLSLVTVLVLGIVVPIRYTVEGGDDRAFSIWMLLVLSSTIVAILTSNDMFFN